MILEKKKEKWQWMHLNKKHQEQTLAREGSVDHLKWGRLILEKPYKAVCLDQAEEPRNPIWDIEGKKKG